jgi:hypothetical protein
MAVVVYKTEFRCKFCTSGHREAIDEILEKRATGQTTPEGLRITRDVALEMIGKLGVENPTIDNIAHHWSKDPTKAHSYYERTVGDAKAAVKQKKVVDIVNPKEVKARRELIEKIFPGWLKDPWPLTADEVAQATQAIGMYDALQKFVRGEKSGITVDHALKGGDLATKRNVGDAAAELMKFAGMAVGMSVKAALESGEKTNLKQLGPVEHEPVIDAEVSEDE